MIEVFKKYVTANKLLAAGEKTLVAASGGLDSTVLCRLFSMTGWPFAIAHCNFQLRGQDSDEDEVFVKKLAGELGVSFDSVRFDTVGFAQKNKLSIQEAARQLRYEWLEEIRKKLDYQRIATAHHLDDSIETVLFNFAKGCGIRGLHGILPGKDHLIRPLLFATRQEIKTFATHENIIFREDASNLTEKYSRNKIRQGVVPVFEKINPSFQASAGATIERLREAEQLYDFAIRMIGKDIMEQHRNEWRISMEKLRSYPAPATVLYELLAPFGFNNNQTVQILQSLDNQPGQTFFAGEWCLVSDRFFFIISRQENVGGVIKIPGISMDLVQLPQGSLTFNLKLKPPDTFPKNPNIAWLDLDKLVFPLTLRHWRPGDVFHPLGMSGHRQSLQDYFTHQKLSRFDKDRIWLLESNGEIVWVVGMRLDERFKVTDLTKQCLLVVFKEHTFADDTTTSVSGC